MLSILAAAAAPEKVREWNSVTIQFADAMLRDLTKAWNMLAAAGGADRNDPTAMTSRLVNIITPELVNNLEAQHKKIVETLDTVKERIPITLKYNQLHAPKRMENKAPAGGGGADIMKQWQKEGSVIPPAQIRVKGVRYRYVSKAYPTSTKRTAALPAAKPNDKLFAYNRSQNQLISSLQKELQDAWHAMHSAMLPKIPQGQPPGDYLIPLFDNSTVKGLEALNAAYGRTIDTAKKWLPKLEALNKPQTAPVPLTNVKQPGKVQVSMDALDEGSQRLVKLWLSQHKVAPGTPQYKALEQKYVQRVLQMNKSESPQEMNKARIYGSARPPKEILVHGVKYRLAARDVTLEDLSADEQGLVKALMSRHPDLKPGTPEYQNMLLKYIQRVLLIPSDHPSNRVMF